MKRIVSLMLVVLLVMSAAITNTYAMGNIYKSTSHIFIEMNLYQGELPKYLRILLAMIGQRSI